MKSWVYKPLVNPMVPGAASKLPVKPMIPGPVNPMIPGAASKLPVRPMIPGAASKLPVNPIILGAASKLPSNPMIPGTASNPQHYLTSSTKNSYQNIMDHFGLGTQTAPKFSRPFKCPEDYGTYPVLENCSNYIQCVSGNPRELTCPSKLVFSMATKTCNFPNATQCPYKCPSDGDFPLFGDCGSYIKCLNGIPTLKVCNPGQHWSKIERRCEDSRVAGCFLKCLHENGTFPYPEDCKFYILCQHGKPHLRKCPKGLFFGIGSLTCQPQHPEHCSLESQCSRQTGRLPVLGDCRMFLECSRLRASDVGGQSVVIKMCPDGMLYNYVTEQCDSANNTVCADQCPQPNGIFEIAGLCDYYKICTGSEPMLQTCPHGLHFDPVRQQCNWPSKAGCIVKCNQKYGTMAVPGKCSQFIKCEDGIPSVRHCPGHLHWNQLLGVCDTPSNSHCDLMCPKKYGLFPIPGRCDEFISCTNGYPKLKRCPSGLHFQNTIKACNFPENAKCDISCPEPDGIFPMDTDCSAFIKCSNNVTTISSCSDDHHFNPMTAQCDLSNNVPCNNLQCPYRNGRFPLPGRPSERFIECNNNEGVMRTCSPGLKLDPLTETCLF